MRKGTVSIILLLVTLQSAVFAQSLSDRDRFIFGLSASPILSWMKADAPEITDSKVRMGIEYGLIMEISFSDNYAISTGVTLQLNGGSLEYQDSLFNMPVTRGIYKLQFVQIPAVFKLMTNQIGYITYYGEFGLLPAFRFRARFDGDYKGVDDEWENENLIKDANSADNATPFESTFFNLSLRVGGGIEYALSGNTAVQVGFFFNNGFINQVKDGDSDKIRMSNVGLRAAILF